MAGSAGLVNESSISYGDASFEASADSSVWDYDAYGNYVEYPYTTPEYWTPGFDAAGNLRSYTISVFNGSGALAYTSSYNIDYASHDGYLETAQRVNSTATGGSGAPLPGSTQHLYNVNNELVRYTDNQDGTKNRFFANNAEGQALDVITGNYASELVALQTAAGVAAHGGGDSTNLLLQEAFVVNGEQVGSIQRHNNLVRTNFDVNYTPISDHYPEATPGTVSAQYGDTLRTVAKRIWGDEKLWYVLAAENGLSDPDAALKIGQVIRVPNELVSLSNTAHSFKPYNFHDAIGDTTPTQPSPPAPVQQGSGGGCGGLGQVLMIAVAIVATVYTAGLASGGSGALLAGGTGATAGSTWAAGAAALSGGLASSGTAIAAAAIGGAVGAAASQAVGVATGTIDSFDWKGVALGAIGAGVGAGLAGSGSIGQAFKGLTSGNIVAQSAVANALTQGIAVVVGVQDHFSWRDVAISAVATPIASKTGKLVNGTSNTSPFMSQFTAGATGSLVRGAFGGRIDTATVLADAFGNALGNSVVDRMSHPSVLEEFTPTVQRMTAPSVGAPGYAEAFLAQHGTVMQLGEELSLNRNPQLFTGAGPTPDELREVQISSQHISTYTARGGDSISGILGTSNPKAIEAFMQLNGLSGSTILAGSRYALPSGEQISAAGGGIGQLALNADNARLDALRSSDAQMATAVSAAGALSIHDLVSSANGAIRFDGSAAASSLNRELLSAGAVNGPVLQAPDDAAEARLQQVRDGLSVALGGPVFGGGTYAGVRMAGGSPELADAAASFQASLVQPMRSSGSNSGMAASVRRGTFIGTAASAAEGSLPKFTFRGDSRLEAEIFRDGFAPRGSSTDLLAHALDNTRPPSAFVPTSRSFDVASGFADSVYVLRPVNGIDVNRTLGSASPFPLEQEIAIFGKVPPSNIRAVTKPAQGISILNPGYEPQ
jgi:hypothetical protein